MFRTAHHASSGALNCICSIWFIYPCRAGRCQGWVENGNDRSPHGYTEAANTFWSSWWWAVCRSKHVEASIYFEI